MKATGLLMIMAALALACGCDTMPWEMPCPEGWVMTAEQTCYDPAADDDSADDDSAK